MGSWLSYGLGNETDELPTYVVLPDGRGGPNGGASNWSNGFLLHSGFCLKSESGKARGVQAGSLAGGQGGAARFIR